MRPEASVPAGHNGRCSIWRSTSPATTGLPAHPELGVSATRSYSWNQMGSSSAGCARGTLSVWSVRTACGGSASNGCQVFLVPMCSAPLWVGR